MRYVKISLWFVILIAIMIVYNISFGMIVTPAGVMGKISASNTIASILYLLVWIFLSVLAGAKKYKTLLTAAIIYSGLPCIGLMGSFFIGTPLAAIVIIPFYWAVPLQGINYALVICLLPLLLIGYMAGDQVAKRIRTGTG